MTLVVLGNACLDVTHRLDRLPEPGETMNALAVTEDLGGKGLNQAVAARRAGASVRFVAPVGDDAVAAMVRRRLEAEGIAADHLLAVPGRSDRSTIMVDRAGENMIVTDAARARGLTPTEVEGRLGICAGDVLVMQGNLSPDVARAAVGQARRAGARVLLNPAPFEPALAALAPLVDILIANTVEASALAGTGDRTRWPERLRVPIAVVTLGAGGCLLTGTAIAPQPIAAPPVEAVDTVGAGDTFVGIFAAEWLATGDPVRAARLAVAAASEKVRRTGTVSALPTREDIARLRRTLAEDTDR